MRLSMQKSDKTTPISTQVNIETGKRNQLNLLHIKNMVSTRSKIAVKAVLTILEIPFASVELEHVQIKISLSDAKRQELKSALLPLGFELADV